MASCEGGLWHLSFPVSCSACSWWRLPFSQCESRRRTKTFGADCRVNARSAFCWHCWLGWHAAAGVGLRKKRSASYAIGAESPSRGARYPSTKTGRRFILSHRRVASLHRPNGGHLYQWRETRRVCLSCGAAGWPLAGMAFQRQAAANAELFGGQTER